MNYHDETRYYWLIAESLRRPLTTAELAELRRLQDEEARELAFAETH